MKSARNPLSKRLPAARRTKSDVQKSDGTVTTSSNASENAQFELTCNEDSLVEDSDVVSTEGGGTEESANEVFGVGDMEFVMDVPVMEFSTDVPVMELDMDVPVLISKVGPSSVDKMPSIVRADFQSEFLKMLSKGKRRKTDASIQLLERQNVDSSLAIKSEQAYECHTVVPKKKKSRPRPSKSAGFQLPASAVCCKVDSQRVMKNSAEDAVKGDMACTVSRSAGYGQTSSSKRISETLSPVAYLDDELVSADGRESLSVNVSASLSKPPCNVSAACYGVEEADVRVSAQCEPNSGTKSAFLPPVLSLPDPITDVAVGPPVLELSYSVSSSSAAISDAVVSICEHRHLLKPSAASVSGGQAVSDDDCTRCARVADATCDTAVDLSFADLVYRPTACSSTVSVSLPSATMSISTATATALRAHLYRNGDSAADRKPAGS